MSKTNVSFWKSSLSLDYTTMAEFSQGHRDKAYNRLPLIRINDNTLEKLSFLRAIDSATHRAKEYYFIHLTFQELFAARYFVRCWIEEKNLACIRFGDDMEFQKADEFIASEKYNGRYDIVWRFVTGLLELQDQDKLSSFMKKLDEPRVVEGLCEISPLEQDILLALLSHEKFRHLDGYQKVIRRQSVLPPNVVDFIVSHLKDPSSQIRFTSVSLLGYQLRLNEDLVDPIIMLRSDSEENVRNVAAVILLGNTKIPQFCVEALVARLESETATDVWMNVASVIEYQETFSEGIVDRIKSLMSSEKTKEPIYGEGYHDGDIKKSRQYSLFRIIQSHSTLYGQDRLAMYREAGSGDVIAIIITISTLKVQGDLPEEILDHFLSLLDPNHPRRRDAARALRYGVKLPKGILDKLLVLLADPNQNVRFLVLMAIDNQDIPPPEFPDAVKAHVTGTNSWDLDTVFHILTGYPVLPCDLLKSLVSVIALDNQYSSGATYVLSHQNTLPEYIIHSLALLLQGELTVMPDNCEKSPRKYFKFYSTLEELEAKYWVRWFKRIFERSFTDGIICYVQNDYLCVEMPEGSFRLNIRCPEDKLDGFEQLECLLDGSLVVSWMFPVTGI
ncbi:hypothetical protein BO71DRAFT_432893 [Aspergillus ellipticus CBS 707.79]|uniref:ARM repeat-containing protein n=1 Tax=Aspergillus ellipticus CBS 707.79 TaxID=1448320 RepID=A0A319D2C1_9EURO|nr:hypothetical protein BO71DRAFT_432893 [Aspergillus ellipticus CBS 707.79]